MQFLVQLPSKRFICNEIHLNNYKDLLKITYGDEPSHEIFVVTFNKILAETANESIENIQSLNLIEAYLLILQIRIQSMGDSSKIIVTQDEKQITIDLNLQNLYYDLLEHYNEFCYSSIESKQTIITFRPPTLERLLLGFSSSDYLTYFSSISLLDKKKELSFNNNTEAQIFFDKLPAKLSSKFIDFHNRFVKSFNQLNFLESYNITDTTLSFMPTIDSFVWFTKLLFNESLDSFYNNLFFLSYLGHMPTSYLETSCTPGEYIYFVKKMQEVLASKNKRSNEDNTNDQAFAGADANVPDDLKDS